MVQCSISQGQLSMSNGSTKRTFRYHLTIKTGSAKSRRLWKRAMYPHQKSQNITCREFLKTFHHFVGTFSFLFFLLRRDSFRAYSGKSPLFWQRKKFGRQNGFSISATIQESHMSKWIQQILGVDHYFQCVPLSSFRFHYITCCGHKTVMYGHIQHLVTILFSVKTMQRFRIWIRFGNEVTSNN